MRRLFPRVLAAVSAAALFVPLPGCGRDDGSKAAAGTSSSEAGRLAERHGDETGQPSVRPVGAPRLEVPPLAPASPRKPAGAIPQGAVRRWYDKIERGQKAGTFEVTWSPSTWQGHKTIRDVTTMRVASARDMAGTVDVFETETVSTTERGEDGTFWWQKSVTTESNGRETVSETTWTGNGYESVTTLNGVEERHRVPTATPTTLDVESFMGSKIAGGEAKPGATWTFRDANVRREKVVEKSVTVLGREDGPGEKGPVPCTKVRETDPETKSETTYWIDDDGAVARLKELSIEVRRVSESAAQRRPAQPASYSITVGAAPPVERCFGAEKALVDVHLRGDPDRPLPDFPASPWSRVVRVEGSDEKGWVVHAEFTAYDAPEAKATFPVTDAAFAKDLEPTVLMPCRHPDVVEQAKRIVGGEKDARRAVKRIADFVFHSLEKQSPEVAEATAVEILRDRRGDCSEHALLCVALCRAAGIPARRCSGFVCVGPLWGSHAWAEVWVGAWMGVDPTTDDVGMAARYLFFGYSDDPESRPEVVSARALGRMRLEITRLWEAGEEVDLTDRASWRTVDAAKKTASHRLAGIEARDWPADWTVSLRGSGDATLTGPGFTARLRVMADQGYRGDRFFRSVSPDSFAPTTFAGVRAVVQPVGRDRQVFACSRRRRVQLALSVSDPSADADAILARLERVLAKTFAPSPRGW